MKIKKSDLRKEINNLQQAIYKNCIDCSGFQPKEAVLCDLKQCPLWAYRPKKLKGLYSLAKRYKQKINLQKLEAEE